MLKYEAKDDFGNPAMAKSFPITVTDRSAPTLSEIDDFQIPLRWGKTVKKYVDDAGKDYQEELDDLTITFPYPTYIDNTATWTEKDDSYN